MELAGGPNTQLKFTVVGAIAVWNAPFSIALP
jgi:hypothetical protein